MTIHLAVSNINLISKYEAVIKKTAHLIVFKFALINKYESVNQPIK